MTTKFMISVLLAMTIFIAPIKAIMILVGLFIFLDTLFGIWCSVKLGVPILSRKLSRIAIKMFIYQMGVLLFYGIDLFIFQDFAKIFSIEIEFFLTKIIGMSFIGLEIFSIDESIKKVKGYGLIFYFKKLMTSAKFLKKEWENINEESNDKP